MTISSQLEASHNEIMDEVVATVEKATETEEDTPLFRRKLQRVLGVPFIAAASTDQFRKEARLGSSQSILRTVLV